MKKLLFIAFSLFFFAQVASAGVVSRTPEVPGVNCADDLPNEGSGPYDAANPNCSKPASLIPDGDGNYLARLDQCIAIGYANEPDDTFPNSVRVGELGGSSYVDREIACFGTLDAGTYFLYLTGSTPSGPAPVWAKMGTPHGLNPRNDTDGFWLQQQNAYGPLNGGARINKSGSFGNFFKDVKANSETPIQFVHPGGLFVLYIKSDGLRGGCVGLSILANYNLACAGSGSGQVVHYKAFKCTTCPDAAGHSAWDNANKLAFVGVNTRTEPAATVEFLHDTTNLYMRCRVPDSQIIATTTGNDLSLLLEDRCQMVMRGNLSTGPRDIDFHNFSINALATGGIHTTHYPGGSSTPSGWNPAITRIVTFAAGEYTIFAIIPKPFAQTDGLKIGFNLVVADQDTAGETLSFACGTTASIVDPLNLCSMELSADIVPSSPDVISPIVSNLSCPTVEKTSFICTAATTENGVARIRYRTTSTPVDSYTKQSSGSQTSTGQVNESLTGTTSNTQHWLDIQVCPPSGPCGDSTEITITTKPDIAPTGCDHFAGNTAAGNQDGSSLANRSLINFFFTRALVNSAVRDLCLDSGTVAAPLIYTGASSMIIPPAGLKGTEALPVTVRAIVHGGVIIDGQGVRRPIQICADNDRFTVEGVNARNSNDNVVQICGGSDNVVIRKVIGWDANVNANTSLLGLNGGTRALVEDSAFFGTARKACSPSQSGVSNHTLRRVFCGYGGTNTGSGTGEMAPGPDMPLTMFYNTYGFTCENCIITWHKTLNAEQLRGLITHDQNKDGTSRETDAAVLGSIAYLANGMPTSVPNLALFIFRHNQIQLKDLVVFLDTNYSTRQAASLQNCRTGNSDSLPVCTNPDLRATNLSLIGGTGNNFIANLWTQTNIVQAATMAGVPSPFQTTPGSGARICFRYEGRVLTTKPLFTTDWQDFFVARFNAAILQAGRTVLEVTGHASGLMALLEQKFGPIPAGCK